MRRRLLAAAAAATLLTALAPATAQAGAVERACLASDRAQGNRALCSCIQQVADQSFGWWDQRKIAKFFRDPHRSQEMRTSSRGSHEVFWTKYRRFGEAAQSYCG